MDVPEYVNPQATTPLQARQEDLLPLLETETVAQSIYLAEHRRSTRDRWYEEPAEVRLAYRRRAVRTLQAQLYGYCETPAPPAGEE